MTEEIGFWLVSFSGALAFLLAIKTERVEAFILYALMFAACTATVVVTI